MGYAEMQRPPKQTAAAGSVAAFLARATLLFGLRIFFVRSRSRDYQVLAILLGRDGCEYCVTVGACTCAYE